MRFSFLFCLSVSVSLFSNNLLSLLSPPLLKSTSHHLHHPLSQFTFSHLFCHPSSHTTSCHLFGHPSGRPPKRGTEESRLGHPSSQSTIYDFFATVPLFLITLIASLATLHYNQHLATPFPNHPFTTSLATLHYNQHLATSLATLHYNQHLATPGLDHKVNSWPPPAMPAVPAPRASLTLATPRPNHSLATPCPSHTISPPPSTPPPPPEGRRSQLLASTVCCWTWSAASAAAASRISSHAFLCLAQGCTWHSLLQTENIGGYVRQLP